MYADENIDYKYTLELTLLFIALWKKNQIQS